MLAQCMYTSICSNPSFVKKVSYNSIYCNDDSTKKQFLHISYVVVVQHDTELGCFLRN